MSRSASQTLPQPAVDPGAPSPIVRLVHVRKSFGSQRVLEDLSLDIQPARVTVILGPSGCGKSVLLKHIVGLIRPDAGEVWVEGRRIDQLRERELREVRLSIGLLFQQGALFDSMTVAQNVAFPLMEHTAMTEQDRRRRIAEVLETVHLDGTQEKLPAQLSGGQRKRIALARAIVLQPRIVLYDEPTTGLDPIRADGINELILKLNRSMGVTSVVVTHDLVSARRVADRVVMIGGGRILADGSFAQLAENPDPHVQRFIFGRYDRTEDDPMNAPEPAAPERKK